LIRISRAYQHANKGDYYLEIDQIDNALEEYKLASKYYPENPELPFWSAVALVSTGKINKALPIFRTVFHKEPRLRILTPRLVKAGLLPDDDELMAKILNIK
jgi:tetratricopeptide (TPR) repeat protein